MITARLVTEGRTSPQELQKAYTKSINPDLRKKIVIYLISEKAPHVEGEPYSIEQVRGRAEYILKGSDPCFDNVVTAYQREFSKMIPSPAQPAVKSETAELLSAINILGQNLQVALRSVPSLPRAGPQNPPSVAGDFSRQE